MATAGTPASATPDRKRSANMPFQLGMSATPSLVLSAMGAVLAHERVIGPIVETGSLIRHGITFGGHPVSAAVALKNIEIFERDGVLENVRAREPYLRRRLEEEVLPLPLVGDVRGEGFFFAAELTPDGGEGRFEPEQIAALVKEIVPRLLLEHGLIARAGNDASAIV